jgi:hypothetical protein
VLQSDLPSTAGMGWHHVRVRSAVFVRSPGYIALCGGIMALFLVVAVGAFLDRTLEGSRDPDWMFWVGATVLVALLVRAPFVGLVIGGDRVIRRTWVRSRSWSKSDITRLGLASYSGSLNRGSRSGRFRMVVLTVRVGSTAEAVEVPEVTGGSRKMEDRLRVLAAALDLPEASPAGRHRPD